MLLPDRCAACGVGEAVVCPGCRASLVVLRPPMCARCGAPTAWPVERCGECAGRRLAFRSARAAVAYAGPARPLVAAWKERGVRRLAAEAASFVADTVPCPNADLLTFVPGDPYRTRWRGHNTAEALARELAARWRLPLARALARTPRVPRQRSLARTARRANVRGTMRARVAVRGRVVLVDDVYTTGATAAAAATELRRAGARSVDVVTFARAIRAAA